MFTDVTAKSIDIIPSAGRVTDTVSIGIQHEDEEDYYEVEVQTNIPKEMGIQSEKLSLEGAKLSKEQEEALAVFLKREGGRLDFELENNNFKLIGRFLKRKSLSIFTSKCGTDGTFSTCQSDNMQSASRLSFLS